MAQKHKNLSEALIIFIKNALKGKVKTRLAATLGDDRALQIYQALLAHTRSVSLSTNADRYLFYSHFVEAEDQWPNADFIKQLQEGDDLGERLINAFQTVFEQHDKVIVIGSDCATLSNEIVAEAFEKLEDFPFVIGPALDGGYYLLGMRQFSPSLFQNIEWSTATVLEESLERIKTLGKECFLLPALSDIDTEADWEKFGWEL